MTDNDNNSKKEETKKSESKYINNIHDKVIRDTLMDKEEGSKTWWNRIELATGASDDFKLYNIYDMAGNVWEWTTGHNIKNGTMFVVPRGGSFYYAGGDYPVVRANGYNVLTKYYQPQCGLSCRALC